MQQCNNRAAVLICKHVHLMMVIYVETCSFVDHVSVNFNFKVWKSLQREGDVITLKLQH
jgi:hypothetical protein